MHVIVGLGNPGNLYRDNRHNIGFLVLDELANYFNIDFKPGKGNYWLTHCSLNENEAILLKPTTYINESGIAVFEYVEQNNIPIEKILVVCDDFQLPLGKIRIRRNGSDGGHNGLASIIYHLQTEEIPRLRCGIASQKMPTEKSRLKDFVLENFENLEIPMLNRMILRARDACITSLKDGIESAMNRFNTDPEENFIN